MHPDPFHYAEYKLYILALAIGRTLSGMLVPHTFHGKHCILVSARALLS